MSALSLVLIVLAPISQPGTAPRQDPRAADLARFQGEWLVASYEEAGVSLPKDVTRDWRIRFKQTSVESIMTDQLQMSGEMRFDPSHSPHAIDLIWKVGDKGKQTVRGIYTFEGEKLKICIGSKPENRPKRFASDAASGSGMMTLERPARPQVAAGAAATRR